MVLDLEWQQDAACYNTYPSVDMLTMQMLYQAEPLIERYCHNCRTMAECAAFGLEMGGDIVGIWGGEFIPIAGSNDRGRNRRRKGIASLRAKAAILRSSGDAA